MYWFRQPLSRMAWISRTLTPSLSTMPRCSASPSSINCADALVVAPTRLTPLQEKRLRAIFEATELGAGFRIAMKDLEIRGAGNLLGAEQSGFMNSVGFDLYCKLLAEAVEELQGKRVETATAPSVQVDLPLDSYLPDEYIGDRTLKVRFYQRLANLSTPEQVEAMEAE